MKKLYKGLTNFYSLSKTLCFELRPQGQTQTNLEMNRILEIDEKKEENAKIVKRLMDDYHKEYIQQQLSSYKLVGLDAYYDLYIKTEKTEEEESSLLSLKDALRIQVANQLANSENYSKLFKKEMIKVLLKGYLEKRGMMKEIAIVSDFDQFTTYFQGYFDIRKNMYSSEEKTSTIGYRLIDENLPMFIKNIESYLKIKETLNFTDYPKLMKITNGRSIDDYFTIEFFNSVLTQKGIDSYNTLLGGYKESDEKQIHGLNVIINQYNQVHAKNERLPKLNMLYKQILSTGDTMSFTINQFDDDKDLMNSIEQLHQMVIQNCFENGNERITAMLSNIQCYDLEHMYISNKELNDFSQAVYHNWSTITKAVEKQYDEVHLKKEVNEKYLDKRKADLKKVKDYSIQELMNMMNEYEDEAGHEIKLYFSLIEDNKDFVNRIQAAYQDIVSIINHVKENEKKLIKNENSIELIKTYLDTVKEYQEFIYSLIPGDQSKEMDMNFYSVLFEIKEIIKEVITVYNQSRNYLTQKPFSKEKCKLNFNSSSLMNGWDLNKENDNLGLIFEKDGLYYLGIMVKGNKNLFDDITADDGEECYRKMQYKLLPGPNKMLPKVFFSKSRRDEFGVTDELYDKYKQGLHLKGNENFSIEFCHELIDFFKRAIQLHTEWKEFGFEFRDTKEYNDIGEFYREVEKQGYMMKFQNVPSDYINSLIEDNKLYFFQIYNKDFSPKKHGNPKLHTLYWKALFDEENLKNPIYKLNGNAEIFYRKASLKREETTIHPANEPIANKNPLNNKKERTFTHDIIKNKRYTIDKYLLHIPITINFQSKGLNNINQVVNQNIKHTDDIHVIGIDRGERNLLYICVINQDGKILHQESLNVIQSEYFNTDYHYLLSDREKKRDEAKKSWKSIENIKDLKMGYISQAIYRIVELMFKYNAIIAIEDLDTGFKNSRVKVEKQVYQKFEKQLIDKLNHLVFKDKANDEEGSLYHSYQLTNKFESFKKLGRQSGILFYVPAKSTSSIDPVTGFISLFRIKYESVKKSVEFFNLFEDIRYNPTHQYYEFVIDDYSKFTQRKFGSRKEWVLCSYGERIRRYRNPEKNSQWEFEECDLTSQFTELFHRFNIDTSHLKESICTQSSKEFFEQLIGLFKLMIQLRNTGQSLEQDYIISPVVGKDGEVFDSRRNVQYLPQNADANDAYNIARKGLMIVDQIQQCDVENMNKFRFKITNDEFIRYIQNLFENENY